MTEFQHLDSPRFSLMVDDFVAASLTHQNSDKDALERLEQSQTLKSPNSLGVKPP